MKKLNVVAIVVIFSVFNLNNAYSRKFQHPGIYQSKGDLDYMKKQCLAGVEPWSSAYNQLKQSADLTSEIHTYSHVYRGPYGKPDLGGTDLRNNAEMAYQCAILWYISGDKKYADRSVEILNVWSQKLIMFDFNDAKLLAGWTGSQLCNAAEILKYSGAGWQKQDIEQFEKILMTVYYPLLKDYFSEANGNWDASIAQCLLAIAVFTEHTQIFDNAVAHLQIAPRNGSILRYIYSDGQCQESIRDQGHVQLGLSEFVGAARIAYTQGTDLFSIAQCRLPRGVEYTARYVLGDSVHCYEKISDDRREISHNYEYIYRHGEAMGLKMPFTKIAADSMRNKTPLHIIAAFRSLPPQKSFNLDFTFLSEKNPVGALSNTTLNRGLKSEFLVSPGQSIQAAIDSASLKKGTVRLSAGTHILPTTLRLPSCVELVGEGIKTILFLDPKSGTRDAIVAADHLLHDVSIRDLVIEGSLTTEPGFDPNSKRSFKATYNRGGIFLGGEKADRMRNLRFENLTVRNCTLNGIYVSGANNVIITKCDLSENGSSMVPGPRLSHNILIVYCDSVTIEENRLVTSPNGSGLKIDQCKEVLVSKNEIARNAAPGVHISESQNIRLNKNEFEANDKSAVAVDFLFNGSKGVVVSENLIQYNNGYGIESHFPYSIDSHLNQFTGNKDKNIGKIR